MLEVVDGEDASGGAELGVAQGGVEQERDKAGGPVVGVHHIGQPAELLAEGEGAAAEEDVAEVVIGIGAPGAGVNLGAAEEALVFEKIDGDGGAGEAGFEGAGPVGVIADIDTERGGARSEIGGGAEAAVGGADDAHIVAEGREFFGQRADHIGQAADFDERFNLGGYEQDF